MNPNLLDRAVALLTTHLDEAQRAAWLTLAFHQQYRALYDAIPQTGAPRDFTVACVRLLLDHGHRDGRLGPDGAYLLPPLVTIAAGTYPIA